MAHPFFDFPLPGNFGHRGAAGVAPENTLVSFERALQDGAHVLESDIQASLEGIPLLLHDAEVNRTTDGQGRVDEMSFAEIKALNAAHCFQAQGAPPFAQAEEGIQIPSLQETFEAFPDARFNLEIKAESPELVARVVGLVVEMGREDRTLLTAGQDRIQLLLRRELERSRAPIAIGASLSDIVDVIRSAESAIPPTTDSMALQIPMAFGENPLVTRELIEHAHRHSIQIHVWTINDPQQMAQLLDLGVDGLITDFPEILDSLLKERA